MNSSVMVTFHIKEAGSPSEAAFQYGTEKQLENGHFTGPVSQHIQGIFSGILKLRGEKSVGGQIFIVLKHYSHLSHRVVLS